MPVQTSSMVTVGAGTVLSVGLLVMEALGAGSTIASARRLTGPGLTNHPVNIVPSSNITVPDDWPLGDDGSITCLTCHEPRPSYRDFPSVRLRKPSGDAAHSSGFCGTCHGASAGHSAAGMHWRAMGVAHLGVDQAHDGAMSHTLDVATKTCLGCHDGVTAADSHRPAALDGGRGYAGESRRSHPVGVPYPSWPGRQDRGKFHPMATLPRKIRLPGGRVSCVSCHDLYAPRDDLLAVPLEGSELCFACHDMR